MSGIQKMVTAAVGMIVTLAGPWVLSKTGVDISGMAETIVTIILGALTVAGVYQVENK